ncbi:MAG: hypothetical protein V3V13_04080 [Paracoccaceae bacterium]
MTEILVRLEVVQHRRWFGVLLLAGLGGCLLYVAALSRLNVGLNGVLLALVGAAFLWAAWRLYLATADTLILNHEGISCETGGLICRLEDIESVDKGFFAFKPSNGFLIRLKQPGPRAWVPGMWWQIGRRIGIGGVTSPRQAKEMVAMIAMDLREKAAQP